MKKNKFITILLISFQLIVFSQQDSSVLMSPQDFLSLVKSNHPMVRKADLKVEIAEKTFNAERGNFDPEISSNLAQKYFEGSEYYNLFGAQLKIPAWFGIEVYSGFDMNSGEYINPERTLPDNGLMYAGISIPIGRDLFIDYRMYEFKKADLYLQSSAFERQLLLNELLLDAAKAYWKWFKSYNALRVYERAYSTAFERFNAVKNAALAGDRPYIDTVEANIHVQNRYLGLINARNEFEITGKYLSTFLWVEGFIPLEMSANIRPPFYETTDAKIFAPVSLKESDSLISSHPKLLMVENKMSYLELEKRYRQEQIKPQLDLKYNFLTEPIGSGNANLSTNNYAFGFEFSSSIFLAEERNNLKVTKLKMEDMALNESLLLNDLSAAIFEANNNWRNSADQVVLWNSVTQNYNTLFEAEATMFNTGESSLFMVNSREMDMINSNLKLIEYIANNHLSSIYTYYSLSILHLQI